MARSHLVIVASDIHFPVQHPQAWKAFVDFVRDNPSTLIIWNGDIIDLPMLSTYPQEVDAEVHASNEILYAIERVNNLLDYTGGMVFVPGNHEARFEKAIFGNRGPNLKGLTGLTLKEQFYSLGLDKDVRWISETKDVPGWVHRSSKTVVRHGHKQAGKYGTANVAAKIARETPGVNVVVGHHHRGQIHTQTVFGRTYFSVANPHLSGNHEYSVHPDWQRGFTVLEFYGHSEFNFCPRVTPHLIIQDDRGRFAWNGKVYG